MSECPYRYYPDNSAFICQSCPYDCYDCNKDGQCSACSSSTDYRVLTNGTNRCLSMQGYYDIGVTACVKCPDGCSSCLSQTSCLSCSEGSYLTPNKVCLSGCPARTLMSNETKTCQACPYDCYTCTRAFCLTCTADDFRVMDESTSRCGCKEGYFDDLTTICKKCLSNCVICRS